MHDDLAHAIEALNKGRRYAAFWESLDKDVKEIGAGKEFVTSLHAQFDVELCDLSLQRPDPPDLIGIDENGLRVGVELAEVVCRETVERNEKGEEVFRVWRTGELSAALSDALSRKDRKTYYGGPLVQLYVCLFTDEPALTPDSARAELATAQFGPFEKITRSFLLFSYDPGTKTYPMLELTHRTK